MSEPDEIIHGLPDGLFRIAGDRIDVFEVIGPVVAADQRNVPELRKTAADLVGEIQRNHAADLPLVQYGKILQSHDDQPIPPAPGSLTQFVEHENKIVIQFGRLQRGRQHTDHPLAGTRQRIPELLRSFAHRPPGLGGDPRLAVDRPGSRTDRHPRRNGDILQSRLFHRFTSMN